MFSQMFRKGKGSATPHAPKGRQGVDTAIGKKRRKPDSRPHRRNKIAKHSTNVRKPPSDVALALSETLKDLSSRKRLKEALGVYWDSSNDSIRDGYHGSIIVDCCSRCGAVEEGEKIIAAMQSAGIVVSVQANTALLKGYAHSGQMKLAIDLFESMCMCKDKWARPNVRTLNTLLRGCLWTASNAHELKNGGFAIAGGVATAEKAWHLSRRIGIAFDSSSYEMSVILLCQALRCEDAERRIEEMKHALGAEECLGTFSASNATIMESVAISVISLARAHALLGERDEALKLAKSTIIAMDSATPSTVTTRAKNDVTPQGGGADVAVGSSENLRTLVTGGKRAWKHTENHRLGGVDLSRRTSSNVLFRSHRLSELKSEATSIIQMCEKQQKALAKPHVLALYLVTRLLYFSGGGTTDLSALERGNSKWASTNNPTETRKQLINSLWLSFGLSTVVSRPSAHIESTSSISVLKKKDHAALREVTGCHQSSVVDDAGFLDFSKVFTSVSEGVGDRAAVGRQPSRPLHIELGSGSGDWIVMQAERNPLHNYVAVELRADRVAQTFSKCMIGSTSSPLENLCCVGSECGVFLRERVKDGSVSAIFVNHPEPPTQTYGSDHSDISSLLAGTNEPAHMLNSETLTAAARCLETDGKGKLIIVTDNRWYARLLCYTLQRVVARNRNLIRQMNLDAAFRCVEEFGGESIAVVPKKHKSNHADIVLYEGKPNESIGHSIPQSANGAESGTSYFDRLWRTGAGSHAEVKKRFIIALRTHAGGTGGSSLERSVSPSRMERKGSGQKKNKKRSAERQKKRNERRLLKKQQAAEQNGSGEKANYIGFQA